jgi:energy-coupling factor transport system ATP-binding protein
VAFIEFDQVSFCYPEDLSNSFALKEIRLNIDSGEFLSIVGANSSGKSTLGRLMNALLLPTDGKVFVNGLDSSEQANTIPIRKQIQMIFQNPDNQIVSTTVEEEVAFGPENLCVPTFEIKKRVDAALQITDLTSYREHPPHLLSGGQKQLLAIASVLAMEPSTIIFDEPTALLDPISRKIILKKIIDLNKKGITIILITHKMEEVLISDRVIVLKKGQIVKDTTPSLLFSNSVDELVDVNLFPPEIIQIIDQLKRKGLPVPSHIISSEELIEFLCQST